MITLYRDAERGDPELFWLDTIRRPVDFSQGSWTFAVSLEQDLVTTPVTAVTVTPQASPTADDGTDAATPSLVLTWAAGALSGFAVGPATLRVKATPATGRARKLKLKVRIDE